MQVQTANVITMNQVNMNRNATATATRHQYNVSIEIDERPQDSTAKAADSTRTGTGIGIHQVLVKLDNCKTFCLNLLLDDGRGHDKKRNNDAAVSQSKTIQTQIISQLSHVSGLPQRMLKLHNFPTATTNSPSSLLPLFVSAYTFLPLRGGKGGFGTLLKGQSKQAGAKRTMDFGACRDLNGRRLRHVNDEIKLRKWREGMQKKMEKAMNDNNNNNNGSSEDIIDIEAEIEQLKTSSGIRNWHLMVPSWSDMGGGGSGLSTKSKRGIERGLRKEVEKVARQSRLEYEAKMKKKSEWERAIMSYAKAGDEYAKEQDQKVTSAVLAGLHKRKKRKVNETDSSSDRKKITGVLKEDEHNKGNSDVVVDIDDDDDKNDFDDSFLSASNICTLSGDLVLDGKPNDSMVNIQSKSEFATATIMLNSSIFHEKLSRYSGLYYEVTVQTCGVAQIGWASLNVAKNGVILPSSGKDSFLPNSDIGDGVGDDAFSYGFDGCRNMSFHNGQEKKFGKGACWNNRDVIGCLYDYDRSTIQYFINGEIIGVAFDLKEGKDNGSNEKKKLLYPAFSLNENEIIGLNLGPAFQYNQEEFLGVCQLIDGERQRSKCTQDSIDSGIGSNADNISQQSNCTDNKRELKAAKKDSNKPDNQQVTNSNNVNSKAIELEKYSSPEELEAVGGDRLKIALFQLGCKCGGSLKERAMRLFSTKGLKREEYPAQLRGKNFQMQS
jgi:hypothetical protein